jgi:transcription-repair coupling factor (superfamily II helicase)
LLTTRPEFRRLRERLAPGEAAPLLTGVNEAARPYLVAALASELPHPILYVMRDNDHVQPTVEALTMLLGREVPVLPYLDRDALPYERLMPDIETVQTRMRTLTTLTHAPGACVVVCSARALTQPILPPRELNEALLELRPGLQLDPRLLLEHLLSLGYEPVAEVEEVGQVSHRGGIVDLFAPVLERPLRVEFWGDEIDSIRTFDPATQRSLNPQEVALVGPAREALALRGPAAAERLAALDTVGLHPDARARWERDLAALRARQSFEDIAFYLPYLHEPASLLDYLPSDGLLVLHDADAPERVATELAEQGEEVRDRLVREGENPPGTLPAFLPW